MVCKTCKEDKVKEPIVRKDVTRFIDQSGRLWNGKVCPDCYKAYNRERMRLKRLELLQKDENSQTLKIE
jgi:type II secretory ATPase GspE/PulE/Tfp pilus assembly ATPase PilB-like protein